MPGAAKQKSLTPKEKQKNHNYWKFNEGFVFNILTGEGKPYSDDAETEISKFCRIFRIDKGNGSYRLIYAPNYGYKNYLRKLLRLYERKLNILDTKDTFHAFRHNRNVITNAEKHVGFNYSAKFDLKDFFNHVTKEMVVDYAISGYCFIGDKLKQGLPTSPIVASLA